MKKVECLLRAFRIEPLIQSCSENKDIFEAFWWSDVRGLAKTEFPEQTAGARFDNPTTSMAHISILVKEQLVQDATELVQNAIDGELHEDEYFMVWSESEIHTAVL